MGSPWFRIFALNREMEGVPAEGLEKNGAEASPDISGGGLPDTHGYRGELLVLKKLAPGRTRTAYLQIRNLNNLNEYA